MTSQAPIKDIEILRGLAVLSVCAHHATGNLFTWGATGWWQWTQYFGGWVGVDIFFAISGFVIARSLLPQLLASHDSTAAWKAIGAFWLRRAWRLLPSAWLWLCLMLLASFIFLNPNTFGSVQSNIEASVAGFFQVANFRFLHTFMQEPYGASFVYWSLSLEEQFYIIFPLLVWFGRRHLVAILILGILFQWLQTRTLTMMAFRSDALMLGVLIALWSAYPSYARWRTILLPNMRYLAAPLLFGVLLALGYIGSDALALGAHGTTAVAMLSALLVWLASWNKDLFTPKWTQRTMLWLGSRSYAIYLIHIPAFFLTRELWARVTPTPLLGSDYFWPYLLTACLLIGVFSELNYRFIEIPGRKKGSAMAKKFNPTVDKNILPSVI